MSTNCVGTYEQYKERLLKMKPNVYLHGQKIDRSNGKQGAERDLADWIQGGTYVMKQCYDTANDPAYADVCLAESKIPGMEGKIVNRCTHIHGSKEDLPDLPPCGRLHAALHGYRRHERPVLRHLRLRPGLRH